MDTIIPQIDAVPRLSHIGPTAASIRSQDALGEQLPSAETVFRRLGIEFNDWIGASHYGCELRGAVRITADRYLYQ